jgi:hypothetical protein
MTQTCTALPCRSRVLLLHMALTEATRPPNGSAPPCPLGRRDRATRQCQTSPLPSVYGLRLYRGYVILLGPLAGHAGEDGPGAALIAGTRCGRRGGVGVSRPR